MAFAGLGAALVGFLMALLLARPFRQLAGAAGQLGRGRFDLDLPRTDVPEAKAISHALLTSAGQLQERLASEQSFAEHASHVLRTTSGSGRWNARSIASASFISASCRSAGASSWWRSSRAARGC